MTQQSTDPPGRVHNLLRPEVLAAFDRETFEREGYWVWENILTDEGRHTWTNSLQKLQQMNDEIVMDTNWGAIDFASRGLKQAIKKQFTPDALDKYCGGSEHIHHFISRELREYMSEQAN
jgi:hypothetical protein